MPSNTISIDATDSGMDALRRRYGLRNKTDGEVAQYMFDRMLSDPNFHRKALPKKRTFLGD